jgi:hypothetical protein
MYQERCVSRETSIRMDRADGGGWDGSWLYRSLMEQQLASQRRCSRRAEESHATPLPDTPRRIYQMMTSPSSVASAEACGMDQSSLSVTLGVSASVADPPYQSQCQKMSSPSRSAFQQMAQVQQHRQIHQEHDLIAGAEANLRCYAVDVMLQTGHALGMSCSGCLTPYAFVKKTEIKENGR